MDRTKLVFMPTDRLELNVELEAFCNKNNEICIYITDTDSKEFQLITLDKHTAIRLVKHLKKEISYIMESEANNG